MENEVDYFPLFLGTPGSAARQLGGIAGDKAGNLTLGCVSTPRQGWDGAPCGLWAVLEMQELLPLLSLLGVWAKEQIYCLLFLRS